MKLNTLRKTPAKVVFDVPTGPFELKGKTTIKI